MLPPHFDIDVFFRAWTCGNDDLVARDRRRAADEPILAAVRSRSAGDSQQ
jgi:hypothetical protein